MIFDLDFATVVNVIILKISCFIRNGIEISIIILFAKSNVS